MLNVLVNGDKINSPRVTVLTSRDVIDHVTNGLTICGLLQVVQSIYRFILLPRYFVETPRAAQSVGAPRGGV